MLLGATEMRWHVERQLRRRLLACSACLVHEAPHATYKARGRKQHKPEHCNLDQREVKEMFVVLVVVVALVVKLERLDDERDEQAAENTVRQATITEKQGGAGSVGVRIEGSRKKSAREWERDRSWRGCLLANASSVGEGI